MGKLLVSILGVAFGVLAMIALAGIADVYLHMSPVVFMAVFCVVAGVANYIMDEKKKSQN